MESPPVGADISDVWLVHRLQHVPSSGAHWRGAAPGEHHMRALLSLLPRKPQLLTSSPPRFHGGSGSTGYSFPIISPDLRTDREALDKLEQPIAAWPASWRRQRLRREGVPKPAPLLTFSWSVDRCGTPQEIISVLAAKVKNAPGG